MKLSNEVKIGITVLLAVVVAYTGFRYMSDIPIFRQTHEVITHFDRVDGLSGGSVVYMNGVRIGSVKSIRLQPEHNVRVSMSIELDVFIPDNSVAYLTSIGFLDGKAVVIERGDSDQMVEYGGEIEGIYVDTMMETLADKGQELGDDISRSFTELNRFLIQLNETLDEESRNSIDESLRNIRGVTETISNLLESRQQDLEQAIASASSTLGQLDSITTENRPKVDSLLTNLDLTVKELNKVSRELDVTVDQVNQILDKINRGEGTMGRLVNDPSLYENVDSLSIELKELIKGINENPGRYLRHMKLIEVF